MEDKKYNLAFGLPVCITDALSDTYGLDLIKRFNVEDLAYCDEYDGEDSLKQSINSFMQNSCGIDTYKHIIITAGATQALNCILRAFSSLSKGIVVTNSYYFQYYDQIIAKNGFSHVKLDLRYETPANGIAIIDSPSNPFGYCYQGNSIAGLTVWDGVYHTPTYINSLTPSIFKHDVMVGSTSKALGTPGLRVGWIATNRDDLYEKLLHEVKYENATISKYSQSMANHLLSSDKIDKFIIKSNSYLNDNREQLRKIENIMNATTPVNGMFMVGDLDSKAICLLDKSNVEYINLDRREPSNGSCVKIRLNLGQRRELVQNAIKSILKTDNR